MQEKGFKFALEHREEDNITHIRLKFFNSRTKRTINIEYKSLVYFVLLGIKIFRFFRKLLRLPRLNSVTTWSDFAEDRSPILAYNHEGMCTLGQTNCI